MRNEGVRGRVARRLVVRFVSETRDGVGHGVRQMDTCVAESDACQRCCPEHGLAGLCIGWVGSSPHQIITTQAERLFAADVTPRIGSLAHRPCERGRRPQAATKRPCREALHRVTKHVEPARYNHSRWQRRSDIGIDEGLGWSQLLRGNGRFGVKPSVVEHGDARDLAARTTRGWAGDMGLEWPRHRVTVTDGSIHVELERRRVRRKEVRRFAGIDHRTSSQRKEAVDLGLPSEASG